jgi:hypothetical protein
MQTVSSAFQSAIIAPERRVKAKVVIDLFDNDQILATGASVTATSTLTQGPITFGASAAFDGQSDLGRPRAVAAVDGSVFPSTSLFPVPANSQAGWWAGVMSNASGVVSPTQYLTINYGAVKTFGAMSISADTTLGYPVDFTIDYSNNGTTWTNHVTVANNTQVVWLHTVSPLVNAQYLRLGITKWSLPNRYPVILEFSNGWTLDSNGALSDRIKTIEIQREAYFEDATSLPVGNYSAATCSIELGNEDGVFYQRNASSPYYGYLKPNKKIKVWFGLYVPGDGAADAEGYVWLPQGTFYTRTFQGGLSKSTVTVQAWDRVKRLSEISWDGSEILAGYTISGLIQFLCQQPSAALSTTDYVVGTNSGNTTTDVLDYAYFEAKPFWDHLAALAEAEAGFLYFDENNVLQFKNRYFFSSTRLSQAHTSGVTVLNVNYSGGVAAGSTIYIMDDSHTDSYTVSSANLVANTITLTGATVRAYPVGSYVSNRAPVITLTDSNTITDLSDEYQLEKMRNKVEIKSSPLTLAINQNGSLVGDEVIFKKDTTQTNQEPFTINAGQTTTLKINFDKVPVLADFTHTATISVLVYGLAGDPATYLDPAYITKSWVDASGNARTNPYAWGGYLKLTNTDSNNRVFVQILVSGYAMERHGGIVGTAKDDILITQYGEKVFSLDNPYVIRSTHAQALANHLMQTWKDPTAPMKISMPARGLFHLQLGDRIKVIQADEGLSDAALNNHFYVVRHHMKFDGGLDSEMDCIAAN